MTNETLCPSCHTARPGVSDDTWDAGEQWRCERCGEKWTRSRLATVAEYEAWDQAYKATGVMPHAVRVTP
jgi:transposase-like protein